jgi:hypothetical protein
VTGLAITGGAQPTLRTRIAIAKEAIADKRYRPHLVIPHAIVGTQGNACVDEGAAAQATADENMHVFAEPYVVEARRRPHAHAAARNLNLAPQVG